MRISTTCVTNALIIPCLCGVRMFDLKWEDRMIAYEYIWDVLLEDFSWGKTL